MTSANQQDAGGVEARILDAALLRFEKVGVKKTTIEDIAKEAGVDRVTVYRRIGSRDDVVQAVITRESAAVLAGLADIATSLDTLDELVAETFILIMRQRREHAMLNRMLSLEPDKILPRLTIDGAPVMAMSVAATIGVLEEAVRRGLLPDHPDLAARAEVVCRVVHSLFLAPATAITLDTDDQLGEFARTYLAPILTR